MAHKPLRLVLVTPETTLLDEPVESLRFPLYDGQIGILPGRAPLVGRLGYGELKIRTTAGTQSYFLDGGFPAGQPQSAPLPTRRAQPAQHPHPQHAANELAVPTPSR